MCHKIPRNALDGGVTAEPGAAMMRIEAARRVFPRCWFNESTTEAGRDALGDYHERKDEDRNAARTGSVMFLSLCSPRSVNIRLNAAAHLIAG